jgi:hypothetical protein
MERHPVQTDGNNGGWVIDSPYGGWNYESPFPGAPSPIFSPFYDGGETDNGFTTGYGPVHTPDGVNPGSVVQSDAPAVGAYANEQFLTLITYEDPASLASQTINILGGFYWGQSSDDIGAVTAIDPMPFLGSELSAFALNQLQLALNRSGYSYGSGAAVNWTVNPNPVLPCPPSSSGSEMQPMSSVSPPPDPPPTPNTAGFGSDPKIYYSYHLSNGTTISGKAEPDQEVSTMLPAVTPFTLYIYQPSTNLSLTTSGITDPSGKVTNLGTLSAQTVGAVDTNGTAFPTRPSWRWACR